MNKLSIILFTIFLTSPILKAQDSTGTKTLLNAHFRNPIKSVKYLGFYFAPEYQYISKNSSFNSGAGFSAMLILNKRMAFGPSFAGSFSPSNRVMIRGLKTEYTIKPDALVHFSIPLTIGIGSTSNRGNDFRPNFDNRQTPPYNQIPQEGRPERGQHQDFDNFRLGQVRFMLQPGLNAEINIIKNIKLYAGATYRFFPVINIENNDQTSSTITNGVSFQGGLKIGLFDQKVNNKE